MTRNEWIQVLKKAKELAEGESYTCAKMFGYLITAIEAQPVRHYRLDDEIEEENEEEE